MSDNNINLIISAKASRMLETVAKVKQSLGGLDKEVANLSGNVYGKFKKSFDSAAASIVAFGKVLGGALIGGSVGLGAFIREGSQLQSLRASFESLTGSIESTNRVMNTLYEYGKLTAFDNKSIQQTAKMFLANGVAIDDLMGWMKNLGDLAGATGADLKGLALPITQAIGSGKLMTQDWYQIINQGAGGLQKYIIAALGAGHSTKTFKDDLEKGRVTAEVFRKALQMASKDGEMAFNGALKQSQTFDGRLSNLKEQITNIGLKILGVDAATGQVKIGGIFDRVSKSVESFTIWLDKNEGKIMDLISTIKSNFVPAIVSIGLAWASLKMGSVIAGLLQFVSAVRTGTNVMAAFGAVISMNPLTLIVGAIAAVVGALAFLQIKFNIFGKAAEWIKDAWNNALSTVGGWISDLKETAEHTFSSVGTWIEENKGWLINLGIVIGTVLLPKIVQIGVKAAASFAAWTQNAAIAGASAIKNFTLISAQAAIGAARVIASGAAAFASWIAGSVMMGTRAIAAFTAMGVQALIAGARIAASWLMAMGPVGAIVAVIAGVVALVIANWEIVSAWMSAFWSWFGEAARAAWNGIVAVFNGVAGFFGGVFRGAWSAITGVFGGIVGFFGGVWNAVTGMFGKLGGFVANSIGGAVKGAVNGALSIVEGMANGFINTINGAIGIINKIPGVNIGNIPQLHIPRLATGGIVGPQGGGSIIYAGDGGQNEWVVPESKMASLVDQINKRRSSGAGNNVTINNTYHVRDNIDIKRISSDLGYLLSQA